MRNFWRKIWDYLYYRHTTVKPRWYGHGYTDPDWLIIGLVFEVLGRFVERELSKTKEEFLTYTDKELIQIWKWFDQEYVNRDYDREFLEGIPRPKLEWIPTNEKFYRLEFRFSSDEDRQKWESADQKRREAIIQDEGTLNRSLQRIVELLPFMWS